jgi:type I restriction enzyme, S subunit
VNWSEKSLDDLGFVGRGKSKHRPRDAEFLYGGPFPFIQTGDVKRAELYVTSYSQTYSEAGLAQSKLWPAGTLCITIAANIAETAILGLDACFPDSVIGFIAYESECDARFIKYTFDTIKRQYQQVSHGAAQDNLSLEKLLSFKLRVPEVEAQHEIADVLSAYDELIENNQRRTGLLEQAARLLYEEWFGRLRFPGHEKNRITNGLPEGWERLPLGDRVTLNYGKSLKEDERIQGEFPVYGSSGIVGDHEKPLTKGPGIIIGRKGNVGSVFWSAKDFWPIDTVYFVDAETSNLYLFYALQHMHFISTDVAVPGLNRDFAYSRQLVVPSKNVLREFLEVAAPIHEQLDKLDELNQKLRVARDLLLPRLISGDMMV